MAIREVLTWPDARLRNKAPIIVADMLTDPDLGKRAEDVIHTMNHHNALGLAATQIGYLDRLFAIRFGDNAKGQPLVAVMLNPEIIQQDGERIEREGCLSFPGMFDAMRAPTWLHVRFRDLRGERIETMLEGQGARAFFHELQHLDGKVMIDRMGKLQRQMFMSRYAKRR